MKSQRMKHFMKLLINYVFFWITIIICFMLIKRAEGSKIFIKDFPNIEASFFNDFTVNGINIYQTAFLTAKGVFFGFFSSNYQVGYILSIVFHVGLLITAGAPIFMLPAFHVMTRGWFVFASYINLFWAVIFLIGFSWPLNPNNFYGSFNEQIYQQFGQDFFNTPILKEQLGILQTAIKENYSFSNYTTWNVLGILSVVGGFVTTIWWQIDNRKLKLPGDEPSQEVEEISTPD